MYGIYTTGTQRHGTAAAALVSRTIYCLARRFEKAFDAGILLFLNGSVRYVHYTAFTMFFYVHGTVFFFFIFPMSHVCFTRDPEHCTKTICRISFSRFVSKTSRVRYIYNDFIIRCFCGKNSIL